MNPSLVGLPDGALDVLGDVVNASEEFYDAVIRPRAGRGWESQRLWLLRLAHDWEVLAALSDVVRLTFFGIPRGAVEAGMCALYVAGRAEGRP